MRKNVLYLITGIFLIMFIPFVVSESFLVSRYTQNPTIQDDFFIQSVDGNFQDKIDCEEKGCWEDNFCYPFGHIKEGQYCSNRDPYYYEKFKIEISSFINRSEENKSCNQSYECKTGVCSEGVCLNLTKQYMEIETLNKEIGFLKDKITGLSINENLVETDEVEEIPEEKGIFRTMINFFKNIFSGKK